MVDTYAICITTQKILMLYYGKACLNMLPYGIPNHSTAEMCARRFPFIYRWRGKCWYQGRARGVDKQKKTPL